MIKESIEKSCGFLIMRRVSQQQQQQFLIMKHRNRYDLPKGHMEGEETEMQTALRELQEETGITSEMITVDNRFRYEEHYSYVRRDRVKVVKTLVIFLGNVKDQFCEKVENIQVTEHGDYMWVNYNLSQVQSVPLLLQKNTIDPLLQKVTDHLTNLGHGSGCQL